MPIIFAGYVKSTKNKPIRKAIVEVNNKIAETNDIGYFRISTYYKQGQPVPKRFVFNIKKEGYGLLSKIYKTGIRNKTWFLTKAYSERIDPRKTNTVVDLRPGVVCKGSLRSQVDWSKFEYRRIPRRVDKDGRFIGEASDKAKKVVAFAEGANIPNEGISVTIPANSLVDSQGKPPNGRVMVTLSTVDIYDPDSMPGNYTVERPKGQIGYMETFGAGSINVTSAGKEYHLKKGEKAKVRIPINRHQLEHVEKLEKRIPVLFYDEKRGIWKEEEKVKGELDEKSGAYIAEIEHFSIMNMDLVFTEIACVVLVNELNQDYELDLSYGGTVIKTKEIQASEQYHIICRLPPNDTIVIQAYSRGICGQLEEYRFPITDPLEVETGDLQDDQPNYCPDSSDPDQRDNCKSTYTLDGSKLGPALSGPTTASCSEFMISWDYTWTAEQYQAGDHFDLEETLTSAPDDFRVIWQTRPGDNQTHIDRNISRPPGEYMYRVRARSTDGVDEHNSAYSNIICVDVDCPTQNNPEALQIINDLDNATAPINWQEKNRVVCVIVGQGAAAREVLNTNGYVDRPGSDTDRIFPSYNMETETRTFVIDDVSLDIDEDERRFYLLQLRLGKWGDGSAPATYSIEFTEVLNCAGADNIEKSRTYKIVEPFLQTQVIRVSEYLPHGDFHPDHPSCTIPEP